MNAPSPAARGRWLVSIGSIVLVGSSLLQWWQIGGGAGELPARSDVGISDGRVFLMFLAAVACLLLLTLPLAARKPIPIDHHAAYLGLFGIAVCGYVLRVADLVGQRLVPLPPPRGIGFWVATVGLVLAAAGVVELFRNRPRRGSSFVAADDTALDALESDQAQDEPEEAAELPGDLPGDLLDEPAADLFDEYPDPSMRPVYVPAVVMRAWHRLYRPSTHLDRSAALDSEPHGRLDRLDLWAVVALVVVILSMRVYDLGQPSQMYFDEVYHARTATEFLQDWNYGLPHDIYEWTHPDLAKYAIAAGITAFSDDRVTATGQIDATVEDVLIEPRSPESPAGMAADPTGSNANLDVRYGDRAFVATGSSVQVYDLDTRDLVHTYEIPGATTFSAVGATGLLYVGTTGGRIYSIDTNSLDDVQNGVAQTVAAPLELAVDTGLAITHVYSGSPPYLLVSNAAGTVVSIDLSQSGGTILGRGVIPGLADIANMGSGPTADPQVIVAYRSGVALMDLPSLRLFSQIPTASPATSIAINYTDASHSLPRDFNPELMSGQSTYVAAGDSLVLIGIDTDTTPWTIVSSGTPLRMPGPITTVVIDDATRIGQALGQAPDGGGAALYSIETNANSVFLDAALPFEPVSIGLDSSPLLSGNDREQVLAFSPDGATATVDVGQFAFSWRIVGVLFGALLAVCLYLLVRLLFRRRSIGLLVALFTLTDGMLFVQSRIAMNDTYVGGFLLLAYLIFAVLWLDVIKSRTRRWIAFWLGMPILGVVLGLALGSKWVALYAIASIGMLILIRSALGRLLTILAMALGTGALGWMAIASMASQRGTGNTAAFVALVGLGSIVFGGGLFAARSMRTVPDRVLVTSVAVLLSAGLFGAALLATPGTVQNGAPNYTFFLIMLAATAIAAAANAYHPITWTREELQFAQGAPLVIGALALADGLVRGNSMALEVGAGALVLAVAVRGAFAYGGKLGVGPLAPPPGPDDPASHADPPGPVPEGWLRLGSGFGLPAVWTVLSVLVLPIVVYVGLYVPWSMPWQPQTPAAVREYAGPLPVLSCPDADANGNCINGDGWPGGHTGKTLIEQTVDMYNYHTDLRAQHPASSPWWAWPMDLKPVWFESVSYAGNVTTMIYDGGNPVLWWLAIFAMGFISWQAFKRRSLGLTLVAFAFFWQWMSWSRIDRAAFEYHFYTAVPFFLAALAYLLAELWHGPSRRTWLLARIAGAAALLFPAVLWLLKDPLCELAQVSSTHNSFSNTVCGAATGDVRIETRMFLVASVLVGALIALALVLRRLERRQTAGLVDRLWIGQLLFPVGIASALLWWIGQNGPGGVVYDAELPSSGITLLLLPILAVLALIVLMARDPRRFVLGVCTFAIIVFVALYPNFAARPMPGNIVDVYEGLLPTWFYGFQFTVNMQAGTQVSPASELGIVIGLAVLVFASIVGWAAWQRRAVVGFRRAQRLSAGGDGSTGEGPATPDQLESTAEPGSNGIESPGSSTSSNDHPRN